MQNIFGSNTLRANATLRESNILWDRGTEVMAHHGHIQVFIKCIYRVRVRRICRRWEAVFYTCHANNVRSMTATRAFRVVHVNRSAVNCSKCILHKTALIERIRMQLDLKIQLIGDPKTRINDRGHCTPVLVNL